ncbi:glucoamylase family protein [Pseudobacter ginsenosidimutans]|nr:glucoamylase family protein [Pseudobacter ginsenosidimutans]
MRKKMTLFAAIVLVTACSRSGSSPDPDPPPTPVNFSFSYWTIDEKPALTTYYDVSRQPLIKFRLPAKIDKASASAAVSLTKHQGGTVPLNLTYEHSDSILVLQPTQQLNHYEKYFLEVASSLKSANGGHLQQPVQLQLVTSLDSSDKYPRITDEQLLSKVQEQTFRYFWDFAHPVSGLARERNTSGDIVTSGGSGFGIMAIVTAVHRNFITRAQALTRLQTIVAFLKNAEKVHGAFPHWLNGATGKIIPFSAKDNGADLVETGYLMQGLLTARQFFNKPDAPEAVLRADINQLWEGVEWSWFRKNNQQELYWHYSADLQWEMNLPIQGWNECLITYVLAAGAPVHTIPKSVYDEGWARNGAMRNNNNYYGVKLPLGPAMGGPLFFSHYSFLGLDPRGLKDAYADYEEQVINHTKINYQYAINNPNHYFGYSDECWGLTASDIPGGYAASSPTNDLGVIAPTAALSSFPYTPSESMKALKFFYYVLGDKLFKEYGFADAFSLKDIWVADSFLAIDQGPIIIMIENYRSGLLWNLFMSCDEVKTGLQKLGFTHPGI